MTMVVVMGGAEAEVDRLNMAWRLTDDEEEGILVPSRLWAANADSHRLCLVGRLLSNRQYLFEGLCDSLHSMLLPVRGMEIKQLQEARILLCFKHIINTGVRGVPMEF
ncbi:UNVERIFIED_CONTAM: hypothetical protein Slati_1398500 [Sesamum latifolium]|uniref:Uncharacterized protein n=1 Tax=Sesamum latifolium TaxID=2727402 RepID=A0AAW2X8G0_9LAMI